MAPTPTPTKPKMEEQLKTLSHQRGAIKGKLTRVKNALEVSDDAPNPNITNLHFLKVHQKLIEQAYREYNEVQNTIYALALSDEKRAEQEAKYVEFESIYSDLSIQLEILIEKLLPKPVPPLVPSAGQVAVLQPAPVIVPQPIVPPLNVPLPTFDGKYEGWYSFKSMFQNVMARYATEAPAIKLYHLRNALVGKAAGIIDQDIINNGDYDAAWAILTDRFEDKRLIIDKHIEAIFCLPKIVKDSAAELRKLVDTCVKNVQALENLELRVEGLGEQMLINQLASKLDRDTRKVWETKQEPGRLPSYANTIEFLKQRCRIMEKVETNSGKTEHSKIVKTVTKSKTLVASEAKVEPKCPVCKAGHELWKCEGFQNKSVSEKYEVLKKCGACFNCLGRNHRIGACPSSRTCRTCGKKHHTTLHFEDTSNKEANSGSSSKPTEASVTTPAKISANPSASAVAGTSTTLCVRAGVLKGQTLLSTAVVLARGLSSTLYPCRVLLDSASQMNLVTERFANLLSLKTDPAD